MHVTNPVCSRTFFAVIQPNIWGLSREFSFSHLVVFWTVFPLFTPYLKSGEYFCLLRNSAHLLRQFSGNFYLLFTRFFLVFFSIVRISNLLRLSRAAHFVIMLVMCVKLLGAFGRFYPTIYYVRPPLILFSY